MASYVWQDDLWQVGSIGKDHVYHVQGPKRAAYSPVVGRMQDSRR